MKSNQNKRILRQRGIFHGNFDGEAEFIRLVRECQARARMLFPDFKLTDDQLPVVFVWSGRVAGMAKRLKEVYNLEFNIEAIHRDWDEMASNTIPHEMAHIVDMYLHGGNSRPHGQEWKRIIKALGGDPKRTHHIPLTKSRRSRKYYYKASCGTIAELGTRHHKAVQRGGKVVVKKTGGIISRKDFTGKVVMK